MHIEKWFFYHAISLLFRYDDYTDKSGGNPSKTNEIIIFVLHYIYTMSYIIIRYYYISIDLKKTQQILEND